MVIDDGGYFNPDEEAPRQSGDGDNKEGEKGWKPTRKQWEEYVKEIDALGDDDPEPPYRGEFADEEEQPADLAELIRSTSDGFDEKAWEQGWQEWLERSKTTETKQPDPELIAVRDSIAKIATSLEQMSRAIAELAEKVSHLQQRPGQSGEAVVQTQAQATGGANVNQIEINVAAENETGQATGEREPGSDTNETGAPTQETAVQQAITELREQVTKLEGQLQTVVRNITGGQHQEQNAGGGTAAASTGEISIINNVTGGVGEQRPTGSANQSESDQGKKPEEKPATKVEYTPKARLRVAPDMLIGQLHLNDEINPREGRRAPESLRAYQDFIHAAFRYLYEKPSRRRGSDAANAQHYAEAWAAFSAFELEAMNELEASLWWELYGRYPEGRRPVLAEAERQIHEAMVQAKVRLMEKIQADLAYKMVVERKITTPLAFDQRLINEYALHYADPKFDIPSDLRHLLRTDAAEFYRLFRELSIQRTMELTRRLGEEVHPEDKTKPHRMLGPEWLTQEIIKRRGSDEKYARLYEAMLSVLVEDTHDRGAAQERTDLAIAQQASAGFEAARRGELSQAEIEDVIALTEQIGRGFNQGMVGTQEQVYARLVRSLPRNLISRLADWHRRDQGKGVLGRTLTGAAMAGILLLTIGATAATVDAYQHDQASEDMGRQVRIMQERNEDLREQRHAREAAQATANNAADSIKSEVSGIAGTATGGSESSESATSRNEARADLLAFDPDLANMSSEQEMGEMAFHEIVAKGWRGATEKGLGLGDEAHADQEIYQKVNYADLMESVRILLGEKRCTELSAEYMSKEVGGIKLSPEQAWGTIQTILQQNQERK